MDLPIAMGFLCSTSATSWNRAVARAAQLLAPRWSGAAGQDDLLRADDLLGTLALTLYMLAHEQDQDVALVSVDAVRAALADRAADGERAWLVRRIGTVLWNSGQVARAEQVPTAAECVHQELSYVWEPLEPMSDYGPDTSRLEDAQPQVLAALEGLDDDQAATLPTVTAGMGVAQIIVNRYVMTVYSRGRSCAENRIICGCGQSAGGTVWVDGPVATYECADGHRRAYRFLTASRVRAALRHLRFGDGTAPAVTHTGRLTVAGNLLVARHDMPEGFDPTSTPITDTSTPTKALL